MKIHGLSHPIPTKYAKRIYNDGKNVFVGKSHLGKVSKGDKFIIYESQGAKAYTGWADIVRVVKMKPSDIITKYSDRLMITSYELNEYAKNRKEMNVIEFENFKKFNNPVVPKRFVALRGKYIYENEFELIKKNKG